MQKQSSTVTGQGNAPAIPLRRTFKGLRQYKAIVTRHGIRQSDTEFSDWFASDEAAEIGYREIMEEQGYKVLSVTIGLPLCVVEVAHE